MGKQYRYELIRGRDNSADNVGDIYGGIDTIEDCGRNDLENEMKTLNEIPIRIPSLRTMLKDIERQFNGCYTIGDYLEEHGYEVAKNGKYVWFVRRR